MMAPVATMDETALAHAAAAGDGQAFATLYERYEGRAFNLCLRITNSREDAADAVQDAFLNVMRRLPSMGDRELNFGSYLFTAARNACYDLMAKSKRSDPTDEIPETAAHMSGGGGFGFEPDDPEDDPERGRLLEAQQEEIREANGRLPERQREALALCELEEMSYDEIAEVMDMNRNSVAQLISRARIKLRDELRGGALATIAASTEECERALPLIAMQDDSQLDEDSEDGAWLAEHMAGCDTCRLSREAMQEAGASYRAWTPVAASALPHEGGDGPRRRADRLGLEQDDRRAGGRPRRRRRRERGGRRLGCGQRASSATAAETPCSRRSSPPSCSSSASRSRSTTTSCRRPPSPWPPTSRPQADKPAEKKAKKSKKAKKDDSGAAAASPDEPASDDQPSDGSSGTAPAARRRRPRTR